MDIFYCCQHGHLDGVKRLIMAKTDVNLDRYIERITPLHIACEYGHLEIVKCLVENGADVNKKMIDGATPLDLTYIFSKNLEIVEFLLRNGAHKIDLPNDYTTKQKKIRDFIENWSRTKAATSIN